jgi:hypothetical protein
MQISEITFQKPRDLKRIFLEHSEQTGNSEMEKVCATDRNKCIDKDITKEETKIYVFYYYYHFV